MYYLILPFLLPLVDLVLILIHQLHQTIATGFDKQGVVYQPDRNIGLSAALVKNGCRRQVLQGRYRDGQIRFAHRNNLRLQGFPKRQLPPIRFFLVYYGFFTDATRHQRKCAHPNGNHIRFHHAINYELLFDAKVKYRILALWMYVDQCGSMWTNGDEKGCMWINVDDSSKISCLPFLQNTPAFYQNTPAFIYLILFNIQIRY